MNRRPGVQKSPSGRRSDIHLATASLKGFGLIRVVVKSKERSSIMKMKLQQVSPSQLILNATSRTMKGKKRV